MATHKVYPKKPTTTVVIPFIRREGLDITTIAILSVILTRKVSVTTIIKTLTDLLTKWVKDTPEGRTAWQDSCADFNIGDYALCEEQFLSWVPHAKLAAKGIQDIKLLSCGDNQEVINFDKILVNQKDLPDGWDKE
jgi:hypothetical protein